MSYLETKCAPVVKKVKKISSLIHPGGGAEACLHLEHSALLCLLNFKKTLMRVQPVKNGKAEIIKIRASTSFPEGTT